VGSIIIHAEGVQASHSVKATGNGGPRKTPAWDLARGKTGISVDLPWVTFREQTLVISGECRRPSAAREAKDTYAYTLEEVTAMLMRLPLRSAAVVSVAAFTGLRKGEISALMWEQYRDGLLYVEKSKWRTHLSGPKTKKSKSPVPVIAPLAKILERWRGTMGNPDSGWMFGSGPLDVENFDDRYIKPFVDNWRGWHAFRRGLSTTLHRLGVPDKDIQQILRHANVSVTQESYIKTATPDALSAMRLLERVVSLPDITEEGRRE
jgi:integrase